MKICEFCYVGLTFPALPHILEARTFFERKVPSMKIVILRPPAVITPILRRMFGIRKEKKR